ncbi:MAG: ATP-binding cassette domain-containing protein [Lachnospiraceae bacterium]|nr:ATP-binding cassette domain-containing protein [Lachnospiraceae bacterium]
MTDIINLSIKEKVYQDKKTKLSILNDFKLEVHAGEKIAIVGESGVGKSSLLNIIGLLDMDYIGEYALWNTPTGKVRGKEMARWRNEKIGFVLQESALINSLTIEDNIKLPLLYAESTKKKLRLEDYEKVVDEIGIRSILKKKPLECSGGQRSRAVFARGIIMKPEIILSDEPTASLDVENRERIVNLLFHMNKEFNTTIITVTHDLEVANRHDRVIRLERR